MGGQLLQRAQAEGFEELQRRRIDIRPAGCLPPPGDLDQGPGKQLRQRPVAAHAPDRFQLGARDRLTVGDERQRFQLGLPQRRPRFRPQEALDQAARRRVRDQLYPVTEALDHQAAPVAERRQFLDGGVDRCGRGRKGAPQLVDRKRTPGDEQQALDQGGQAERRRLRIVPVSSHVVSSHLSGCCSGARRANAAAALSRCRRRASLAALLSRQCARG